MRHILLQFKILQLILTIACMVRYIMDTWKEKEGEDLSSFTQRHFIYAMCFGVGTLNICGIVVILTGLATSIFLEAIISLLGTVGFSIIYYLWIADYMDSFLACSVLLFFLLQTLLSWEILFSSGEEAPPDITYAKEPFSHEFFFCGLYFMFIVFNLLAIIAIFVGLPVLVLHEAVYAFFGAVGFIVAAFLSMGHAERDFHLTYLTDQEEFMHPYFRKLRLQSIFSLTLGYLYLLHGMLTLDIYLAVKNKRENTLFAEPDKDQFPTHLFVVSRTFANWLVRHFPRCCKYIAIDNEKEPGLFPD